MWWLSAALIAGITRRTGAGLFIMGAAVIAAGWRDRSVARTVGAAALCALCLMHGVLSAQRLADDRACFLAASRAGGTLDLTGVVASFPRIYPYGTEFAFDTAVPSGDAMHRVRVRLRATRFDVHYGSHLRVRARLVDSRTPLRALYASGIVGVVRAGYADVTVETTLRAVTWRSIPWRIHRHARVVLSRRLGSRAGLPLALLLGERGFVDRRTRDAFSRLGITHLLALSGMHLGIVAGLVWLLLGRRGSRRRVRLVVLGCLLLSYVGVVGEVVSLHRALVMAVVLIAARLLERPASALRALGQALFLLLVLAPASVYSVGFQLSFAATFAVLVTVTALPRPRFRGSLRRALASAVVGPAASTGVLVLVAPIQLAYFGVVSVLSPLATVAFLPAVAALLVGAAAAVAAAGIPGAGPALCDALRWFSDATSAIAVTAADHAIDPVALPVPDMAVYYTGLAVAWGGRRRAWAVAAGVCVCAAAFWMGAH